MQQRLSESLGGLPEDQQADINVGPIRTYQGHRFNNLDLKTWDSYYDRRSVITYQDEDFMTYYAGAHSGSTVCVLLHGAGHTAMSWAVVAV